MLPSREVANAVPPACGAGRVLLSQKAARDLRPSPQHQFGPLAGKGANLIRICSTTQLTESNRLSDEVPMYPIPTNAPFSSRTDDTEKISQARTPRRHHFR
jgi:hypothetical protein